ncbi:MAG: hypothetical protein JXA38_05660 [Methanosarcinaceae archaeon]|nr:hypothetical protein [Methanosarcinaceae archaeon]
MYACVNDPVLGGRVYLDLAFEYIQFRYNDGSCSKETVNTVNIEGIVTEEDLVNGVVNELRGDVINESDLMVRILEDIFKIDVDGCPDLVASIHERLANQEMANIEIYAGGLN